MRNRRRGQTRLSAVSATYGASARADAVTDAKLPAGLRWTYCSRFPRRVLLRDAAVASEYAGGAFEFGPSCR